MSRVLTGSVLGTGSHRLAAAPRDQLDPVVRDLLDKATAEGYERGLRDGHAQGVAAAEARSVAQLDQLTASVTGAVEQAARMAKDACDQDIESAFELAMAIAEAVIGHQPHDGGEVVAERVRETLGLLADPTAVVRVNPDEQELVATALGDLSGVIVEADPMLGPGEARVRGGWAEADLTRATAFAAIRRDLGVDH